jgi:hypothetical protein
MTVCLEVDPNVELLCFVVKKLDTGRNASHWNILKNKTVAQNQRHVNKTLKKFTVFNVDKNKLKLLLMLLRSAVINLGVCKKLEGVRQMLNSLILFG